MIEVTGVSKSYATRHGDVSVLKDINFSVNASEKIGILGRNGSGKSTLMRLISGVEQPSTGSVSRKMSVSWPLAFGGAFQGTLTGEDNLRFICRIYGVSFSEKVDFVAEFSELGRYLKEPVKSYSSGMRARLAFAISMAIEFDCFLIDEVIAVGDSRFHEKCQQELFEKRSDRAMIIVSHDIHYVERHCDRVAVLDNGKLIECASISDALMLYK